MPQKLSTLLATLVLFSDAQTTCKSVKDAYQDAQCCPEGSSPNDFVSSLYSCDGISGNPVQWTKMAVMGSSPGKSIRNAKDDIYAFLEGDTFKFATKGPGWSGMQVQDIGGVPENWGEWYPHLEVAISSHTIINATTWKTTDALSNFAGCDLASGTTKEVAVDACLYMYNHPEIISYTADSTCTVERYNGLAFGLIAGDSIGAFHYDEMLQIHDSDKEVAMDSEWRENFKFNTHVKTYCQAKIAAQRDKATSWDLDPIATLALDAYRFTPRIYFYGGENDIKKEYKSPCRS